jgi:hypothetical protein
VFGTAVQSTPFSLAGGKAAFGGMRPGATRTGFEEDEEEDGDPNPGVQRVELREGEISLEQVCLAFYHVFRDLEIDFLCVCVQGETNYYAERVEKLPILDHCSYILLIYNPYSLYITYFSTPSPLCFEFRSCFPCEFHALFVFRCIGIWTGLVDC